MSRNYSQGFFAVKNPEKYMGKGRPKFRSSWEHAFMRFCDNNESVTGWASESIAIPYRHPLTGQMAKYIPDFLIQYRTRDNRVLTELVEIKPKKQSLIESKASMQDKVAVAINYAKWASAQEFCKRYNIKFRVITEDDLFRGGNR